MLIVDETPDSRMRFTFDFGPCFPAGRVGVVLAADVVRSLSPAQIRSKVVDAVIDHVEITAPSSKISRIARFAKIDLKTIASDALIRYRVDRLVSAGPATPRLP